ncbi:MAG: type 2 isopentenyl-diphosphate Delta-isomerase [Thermoplasmata archaeon]|nr:MAG: type 2 isopentenyl-diphosphate Delta-isomerase [Thermoplasmata archaeon]
MTTPEIIRRKSDHVEICLRDDILNSTNHWDDVQLIHCALPEVDLDQVDTTTELLGVTIGAPLVIASMTGGHGHGTVINDNLAAAAAELRLPMGVGSQRPALEHPEYADTFTPIKDHDVPLVIANLGAPQLIDQREGKAVKADDIRGLMDLVEADVLAVHLNFLQEVAQPEGDTKAAGVLEAIAELSEDIPIIAKETGAGISHAVAMELLEAGVKAIDVGGAGGTSFSAVEAVRSEDRGLDDLAKLGWVFKDWGIPTPVSVIECSAVGLPVIATGGVRHGLDVARSLVLGASAAGMARAVLGPAVAGADETMAALRGTLRELRAAMFLVGVGNVPDLQVQEFILSDSILAWLARFEGDE